MKFETGTIRDLHANRVSFKDYHSDQFYHIKVFRVFGTP